MITVNVPAIRKIRNIAFPLQQWLNKRAMKLIYTCIACLALFSLSNSVAKRTIFRQKNIEGAFAPACTPKLRLCLLVNLLCLTGRKVSLSA